MKKLAPRIVVLTTLALTACATSTPMPISPPPSTTSLQPTAVPVPATIPATAVPSPTPRIFTTADLPDLVLQPGELPPPTENEPAFNQQTDLVAGFGPELANQFRELGIQANFLQGTKTVKPCNDICSVFSWTLLFKDADGAQKALNVLESGDPAQYQNAKTLPATGLGDAGYGVQGDLTSMGFEVIKYVWRVNNVIICVHYNVQPGTINPEDVLTTAINVQEHTR